MRAYSERAFQLTIKTKFWKRSSSKTTILSKALLIRMWSQVLSFYNRRHKAIPGQSDNSNSALSDLWEINENRQYKYNFSDYPKYQGSFGSEEENYSNCLLIFSGKSSSQIIGQQNELKQCLHRHRTLHHEVWSGILERYPIFAKNYWNHVGYLQIVWLYFRKQKGEEPGLEEKCQSVQKGLYRGKTWDVWIEDGTG